MEETKRSIAQTALMAVASSQIFAVGHNAESKILTVQFPKREGGKIVGGGSVYQCANVDTAKADAFMASESKGKFFGDHIKPMESVHPFIKLEPHEVDQHITLPAVEQEAQAPKFPTMLRKMWSGGEAQDWIDRNWPVAAKPDHVQESLKTASAYVTKQQNEFQERLRSNECESQLVKLSDETFAQLHKMNGDAWLDEGHRELVVDTMLNYAIPEYRRKVSDGLFAEHIAAVQTSN